MRAFVSAQNILFAKQKNKRQKIPNTEPDKDNPRNPNEDFPNEPNQ